MSMGWSVSMRVLTANHLLLKTGSNLHKFKRIFRVQSHYKQVKDSLFDYCKRLKTCKN